MEEAVSEAYTLGLEGTDDGVLDYAGAGIHLQRKVTLEVHHRRLAPTYGSSIRYQ